jgi:hypothetical protein
MQHFVPTNYFSGYHSMQIRDTEKLMACKKAGITLIAIPYWWDYRKESLAATIKEVILIHNNHFTLTLEMPAPAITQLGFYWRSDTFLHGRE